VDTAIFFNFFIYVRGHFFCGKRLQFAVVKSGSQWIDRRLLILREQIPWALIDGYECANTVCLLV
jgi:hypothetical protein